MPVAAFLTPNLAAPGRRYGLLTPRDVAPRRVRLVITAKKRAAKPSKGAPTPKPSPSPPPTSSSAGDDSFAGFAAGPAASAAKPRLTRPTKRAEAPSDEPGAPADAVPVAEEAKQLEPEEAEPEEPAPELRATRALGTSEPRVPEKIGRKTAADFIAEGVVDDADEMDTLDSIDSLEEVAAYAAADIRFGIADVKDPFLEEESAAQILQREEAAEAEREAVGKPLDVTGDGGVTKRLISPGEGEVVTQGAKVCVEYTGTLADDGTQFDSSRGREGGFSFELGAGAVIKGWEAGVATMRVGETAELTIEPGYAYGRRGMPPVIPGNATLKFEIEVVSREGGQESEVKSVASFNPEISRTPDAIARDYEQMLETQEERRQGKTWLQRLYFISPFMSQTGEKPPWWINPNITFSIIVISTVIGFFLVVKSGAIHIGYTENVDVNIFK